VTIQMVGLALLVAAGAPIVWRTARGLARGRFAADVVASLAIITAVALREPLAGLVIVLMQSGGEYLERYAARRASRALDELEDARPHLAHRLRGDVVEEISADAVEPGDVLLVRPGDMVPVDGEVVAGESWVDRSRLTGESVPVAVQPGARLMSATLNGDRPFRMRAVARAAESQYAKIVELVRSAQESKAPLQRVADRYAAWFTPFTLVVCAVTLALTDDWSRVLAILVVATPCPLILATPVAIVGGISHAARHRIIVRHGGALEALARVTAAVFDKTGTLTVGRPEVSRVVPAASWEADTVLRLAAAVEHSAGHQLGRSIVQAARGRNGVALPSAREIVESPGRGVAGMVEERRVAVGSRGYITDRWPLAAPGMATLEPRGEALRSFVAVDGEAAGMIEFDDVVRHDVSTTFARMRRHGIKRTMLLSGDHSAYVRAVADRVGIADARGNLLPADKVAVVQQLQRAGERVLMVGDGVNDAPALSRAEVGMALAAHGRGIASESADVILLEDDLTGVAEAIEIARKTMRVARQSILVGLGLSAVAMGFAAAGMIPPVMGAALQEGIDVAVILNALRTSR
jgi:heavy metal translocating P-type ATPase